MYLQPVQSLLAQRIANTKLQECSANIAGCTWYTPKMITHSNGIESMYYRESYTQSSSSITVCMFVRHTGLNTSSSNIECWLSSFIIHCLHQHKFEPIQAILYTAVLHAVKSLSKSGIKLPFVGQKVLQIILIPRLPESGDETRKTYSSVRGEEEWGTPFPGSPCCLAARTPRHETAVANEQKIKHDPAQSDIRQYPIQYVSDTDTDTRKSLPPNTTEEVTGHNHIPRCGTRLKISSLQYNDLLLINIVARG